MAANLRPIQSAELVGMQRPILLLVFAIDE
jgi:hypothetical protein